MLRDQVIDAIAQAISKMEGYDKAGSLAERNANPGNVRQWRDKTNKPYPTFKSYVDFVEWASDNHRGATTEDIGNAARAEGWRVLHVVIGQYLDGKYTYSDPITKKTKKVETFFEMFAAYAPAEDHNQPKVYAQFVADKLGTTPFTRISDLITA